MAVRIVLDTNVWVSGLLWKGLPWRILRLAELNSVELYATPAILAELETVLAYPKFQARLHSLKLTPGDLTHFALHLTMLVETFAGPTIVIQDPDDDVFLRCATAASAQYIVSGDQHLLAFGDWRGISVITARNFMAREFPAWLD